MHTTAPSLNKYTPITLTLCYSLIYVYEKKTFNIHAPVFHVLVLVHICLQLGEPGKKLQHALKQIILHMHIV